jgi:hypothetical protein
MIESAATSPKVKDAAILLGTAPDAAMARRRAIDLALSGERGLMALGAA